MKTIETREDVRKLVDIFYAKIRKDDLLGDIFNSHIAENEWETHLEKLTDFWETNLFGVPRFKGNPTKKHLQVDQNLQYNVSQEHFGRWLQLWFETINNLFQGERAIRAKEAARKMAHGQFMAIYMNRPQNIEE